MRLRANVQINSGYGTFPAGQKFTIPDPVGRAWVEARLASEVTEADEVDDADPAATAPPEKPLHRMNKAELQAIASELQIDTGGSNKDLVERITAARASQSA